MKHDAKKTAFLNSMGIRVLRFENIWVFKDVEYVLGEIRKCFY